jgi:predicted nucleotidyltransferase
MDTKDEIVNTIKALHSHLTKYKVREIGVFGSVVRGEHN